MGSDRMGSQRSTPTAALARPEWRCTKCGAEWSWLWSWGDTFHRFPQALRETPWWLLPAVFAFMPIALAFEIGEHGAGAACRGCGRKCVRVRGPQ